VAGRAGVVGGARAALFGFCITTASMVALLYPARPLVEVAVVVSALIGLVFALAGLGTALGRSRILLAVPVALGFMAILSAAGTLYVLDRAGLRGRLFYATAGVVTTALAATSAVGFWHGLWRVLPHGAPNQVPASVVDTGQPMA
jgi:hypothetical protein